MPNQGTESQFEETTIDRLLALPGYRYQYGGRVVFSVEPGGRITGQMVSDHTLEEVAQDLTERQRQVLEVLGSASGGSMALREIAAQLPKHTSRMLREDLGILKTLGLVKTTGWARSARWRLN